MTSAITLADGRGMQQSNLAISSMLWLIAMETRAVPLRRWLCDVSDRPGGFLDVDIGGLALDDQDEFWSAAQRALAMLAEKHGPGFLDRNNAYGANALAYLIEMRRREMAGESPSLFSDFFKEREGEPEKIDLSELWSDEEGGV